MKNKKQPNKIKLTNPIPYEKDFRFFDMNMKIRVENMNGSKNQKIEAFPKGKHKNTELRQQQMDIIYKYLLAEGFLREAETHNLYF